MAHTRHVTRATLRKRIPMPATDVRGNLTLTSGRLSFRGDDRVVVFDHPVGEFRSVTTRGRGFAVVHGDRTYRIMVGPGTPSNALSNAADPVPSDALSWLLSWTGRRGGRRRAHDARDEWVELLRPLVGADAV